MSITLATPPLSVSLSFSRYSLHFIDSINIPPFAPSTQAKMCLVTFKYIRQRWCLPEEATSVGSSHLRWCHPQCQLPALSHELQDKVKMSFFFFFILYFWKMNGFLDI